MPWPVGSCAGSILVVEDEVVLRMDLGDHLRSSGFTVLRGAEWRRCAYRLEFGSRT